MPTERTRLAGVYLLTPDARGDAFAAVLGTVGSALEAGVRAVQYRSKVADPPERERQARALVRLVQSAGGLAIVNDDPDLAVSIGADGVHIGRDDGDVRVVRRRLPDRLLGVSCYDQLPRAEQAVAEGADAIAFGAVFASLTKPGAVRAPLELIAAARGRWPTRRVIAIGGIDEGNIHEVAEAGAHAAAVISAVFGAADPRRAAQTLVRQFDEGRRRHESQRAAV
jgi:thiamine-phosphate pyrophosphorylase